MPRSRCAFVRSSHRRPAFGAIRRLLALGLCAVVSARGAGLPPYFGAALAGFSPDVPRGWAYTLSVRRGSETSVESFDPSQPAGRQWALRQHDGRMPTTSETERYRRYRETTGATTGVRATFARGDLDYSSARVTHEDAAGAVVHCVFRSDAVEPMLAHLELFLSLEKEPPAIEQATLRLTRPYSPVFGMKMGELEVTTTYTRPSGDGPGLPLRTVSRFRGHVLWFWSIEEDTLVTYADYRRVRPAGERAEQPGERRAGPAPRRPDPRGWPVF